MTGTGNSHNLLSANGVMESHESISLTAIVWCPIFILPDQRQAADAVRSEMYAVQLLPCSLAAASSIYYPTPRSGQQYPPNLYDLPKRRGAFKRPLFILGEGAHYVSEGQRRFCGHPRTRHWIRTQNELDMP